MPSMRLRLAVLLLAFAAVRGDEAEAKLRGALKVQAALAEAEEMVRRGTFPAAVAVLEKHIAHIDGNRRYLVLLRDAYQGAIAQHREAGHADKAARLHERLLILQPVAGLAPPSKAAEAPRTAVRAKGDERPDDPFSDENRVVPAGSAGLAERAEQAFAAKDYERAGQLYEDAESASPGCTEASKWKRGYCKLHRVGRIINGDGIPVGEELEQEVALGLKLAPSMGKFADTLRARMKEAVASVDVRHTPREGTGWALAETANFRVFHAATEAQAARAARLAEAARTAMARKWLGEVPPAWVPRCDIYLMMGMLQVLINENL
ncbi:MAG: hypothetical protein K2W96_23060 [Gemmataceae bacterium]|nr:hypothetical protein [Gemmataceae bacterium]